MTDRAPSGNGVTAALKPLGTPGFVQFGGYVVEEWDARLKGRRGPDAYREMAEASSILGAALSAWEAMVLAAGYRIEPADETAQGAREAGFLEEAFDDMEGAWSDTFRDLATYRPYGFALLNIVYKRRRGPTNDPRTSSRYQDGRLGWQRWSPRAAGTIERWEFDDEDAATTAVQVIPRSGKVVPIPLDRCLHVIARPRRGSPEGLSVLRNCYDDYYHLKHIKRIEAIGVERDLAGFPVLRVPGQVIQEGGTAYENWKTAGRDIRRDEQGFLLLPSDFYPGTSNRMYDVELLSSGGERQIDTDKIMARYALWMLRSLLVDFLTLGDQAVGSYAQSTNRTDLFLQAVQGELQSVEDAINQQAVWRLWALNGLPFATMPRFRFNEVRRRDVREFAETVVALAQVSAIDVLDSEVKRVVYEVVGLPLPVETAAEEAEEEGETVAVRRGEADEEAQVPAVAAGERRFADEGDDDLVTVDEAAIEEAMALWDRLMPEQAGMLAAKVT